MDYKGKKFVYLGTSTKRDYDQWWDDQAVIEKKEFCLTRQYKRFLDEKRKAEIIERLRLAKAKCEYLYNKYGEVDQYDYDDFERALFDYNRYILGIE